MAPAQFSQTFLTRRCRNQSSLAVRLLQQKNVPNGHLLGPAESAVNEVVSFRMAKKRQMRWSYEGAHLLAQVRVHVLNGDLHPRAIATPLRQSKPLRKSNNHACFKLKAA